jgi:hypothetical protein
MNWAIYVPMFISCAFIIAAVGILGANAGDKDTYSVDKTTIGLVLGLSAGATLFFIIGLFLYVSRFPASAINVLSIVTSLNLFTSLAAIGISTLVKL